jgi:hypothetical protein
MMGYIFSGLMILLFATSNAFSNEIAWNTEELVKMDGFRPAKYEKAIYWRGCDGKQPNDCTVHVDSILIMNRHEMIKRADGKQITIRHYTPVDPKALPKMDLESPVGYKIFLSDKRWGTCIEFSHNKSVDEIQYQRWRSIMLIPWQGPKPGLSAYRFFSYWGTCSSLAEGMNEGEVILPVIEPGISLRLVWHRCNADDCIVTEDKRAIDFFDNSEDGVISIKSKITRNVDSQQKPQDIPMRTGPLP